MITAIVLYDLPPSIGLEECRKHFRTSEIGIERTIRAGSMMSVDRD